MLPTPRKPRLTNPKFIVEPLGIKEAKRFCVDWHYSNIFPPHCMLQLCYRDSLGISGVALWGWGVRPMHTIQRLFPSLSTDHYWELNRLCLRDECPKNSESWFIARCADWMREHQPNIKILLSWADGVRGKPGYIYQASGWLYGGFIETSIYLTSEGEPVHPRSIITRFGSREQSITESLGLTKISGRQFIYCKLLTGKTETKRLLSESPTKWGTNYPKKNRLGLVYT